MVQSFFKLIRWQNLLIIALTQYLIRYCIVKPVLSQDLINTVFSVPDFFLLVVSTVFIAGAGYIINDYFDTKTDYVNKPGKNVVNTGLNKKVVFGLFVAFNLIGILLGVYISFKVSCIEFSFVYLLISGLLWFYSTTYKRQVLIGNLIVAILTGAVPLIVLFFEIVPIISLYGSSFLAKDTLSGIVWFTEGLAVFAFLITLIREIVKDTEDFEGDYIDSRNTIPIFFGIIVTKVIILVLTSFLIFGVILVYIRYLKLGLFPLLYVIAVIALPLFIVLIKILIAKERKDYTFSSSILKFVIVSGILFMWIVKINIT